MLQKLCAFVSQPIDDRPGSFLFAMFALHKHMRASRWMNNERFWFVMRCERSHKAVHRKRSAFFFARRCKRFWLIKFSVWRKRRNYHLDGANGLVEMLQRIVRSSFRHVVKIVYFFSVFSEYPNSLAEHDAMTLILAMIISSHFIPFVFFLALSTSYGITDVDIKCSPDAGFAEIIIHFVRHAKISNEKQR